MFRFLEIYIPRGISLCIIYYDFIKQFQTIFSGEQDPQPYIKTFKTNNGYGVASVAGITSRNGRVSSISGVNFFPSGSNPFNFPAGKSGEKIPEPISFTKEEDGTLTAGHIKYGPSGSVSVSSFAGQAFPESSAKVKSAMKTPDQMFKASNFKMNNMIYQDPFAHFSSRSFNPWFPSMFMFRQPMFENTNMPRQGWPYSNFSPFFNYWRR